MPQSFISLTYHLIFSTKQREPTLREELRPRLFEYVGGTLRAEQGQLLAAGGMPDHLHLLVALHQTTSFADAMRTIKANSSRWIHENVADLRGFAWQAGYGAFAVSDSSLPDVKLYLEQQAEHHRSRTFQEEFLAFLSRHGISYDERYLWD